jgi:Zn-dependent protease with chaperone function/Tfp pilus assembly protein PilF
MPRRFAIVLTALILSVAPARAASDDSSYSSDDKIFKDGGDRLMYEQQYQAAESLYHHVLDDQPNSPLALMDHVKALNALGRHEEAVLDARKAVELAPDDADENNLLGTTLVIAHQDSEAISVLRTSLALAAKPDDDKTTILWLAIAYLHSGQKPQADLILESEAKVGDAANQAQTAMRIADVFHQAGDDVTAVEWWRRSYNLGNTDAARFLTWAYEGGTGVPYDDAASNYWSRRTDNPPFAWFPRLGLADKIVAWAHGWGVVGIMLASAIVLPWITISLIAFFPARSLINEPTFPWMERARRAYPFMMMLSYGVLLPPLVDLVSIIYYPAFVLPISKWILMWIVPAVGFWSCNVVVVYWSWFYRHEPITAAQNMKDIGITLLIYLPSFAIFLVMAFTLPDHFGWQAALEIIAAILAYFYVQFGGWIRLAHLGRLIRPAGQELTADAAELAQHWQIRAPTVWLIPWRKANAFAFTFANAIVVTEKLHAILNRAETRSVLAHELAHLCEDRATLAMRLAVPLLLLPIFTANLWSSTYILLAPAGSYLLFLLGAMVMRRRARRMEERADSFGKAAESEAGIYPLALAKLYAANLIPAVMPGKKKVHPHLYDRLLAAGITPDYPRPKPPGRWGGFAGLLVVILNALGLAALWLALF